MLVGFKAQNHPQQATKDGVDDRSLPDGHFWVLQKRFAFTIDVAASDKNHRLPRFVTREQDGLSVSWAGERVYCNPPFSDIRPWIEKSWRETEAQLVVMLLPANRTEQGFWQDLVEPKRDRVGTPLRVEFLRNRIAFYKPGQAIIGSNERPPFGCCLLIWDYQNAPSGTLCSDIPKQTS